MTQLDSLNPDSLAQGLESLSAVDTDLARIYVGLGPPPLWQREPGFPTLVHIILEQQVSLASARAAFLKLQQAAGTITPGAFLKFDSDELKRIGFSRQKASYCRALATAILNHELDLEDLARHEDDKVRSALLKIKGIGPWTADIYQLMVLLRPDSWPSGDLALAVAVQDLKGLSTRPTPAELEEFARPWQPWRAVAARLLWHYYLSERGLA